MLLHKSNYLYKVSSLQEKFSFLEEPDDSFLRVKTPSLFFPTKCCHNDQVGTVIHRSIRTFIILISIIIFKNK